MRLRKLRERLARVVKENLSLKRKLLASFSKILMMRMQRTVEWRLSASHDLLRGLKEMKGLGSKTGLVLALLSV